MGVIEKLLPGAAEHHFAVFQHITAMGDTQGMDDVLLDDQHGRAQFQDLVDDLENL
ncbi:hypothetical protein D3C76_1615360 [compost metagenome]